MSTLSETEIESILARYEPWLHSVAQKKYPSFSEDDMVQEAMISMWKELQKYNSGSVPVDVIMRNRALWRMSSVSKRRKHEELLGFESVSDLEDYSAAVSMDNAEFRSHRQDIVDILNDCLTFKQKLFMVAKYAYGCGGSEMREIFGYEPHGAVGKSTIQRMQKSLDHLKSMVR